MERFKCIDGNNINFNLINLIEPYMDKTLSQGCFFNLKGELYEISSVCYYNDKIDEIHYIKNNELYGIDIDKFNSECEVIGHYDIQAVIDFILDKLETDFVDENIQFNIELSGYYVLNVDNIDEMFDIIRGIQFPNKELKLYTNEEVNKLINNLEKINKFSEKYY